jgi:spore germination protein GerM
MGVKTEGTMRKPLVAGVLLLALALAALTGACGDDDDDSSPTPDTVDVVLYFPLVTATDVEFVAVERSVASDQAGPAAVVQLLLDGPTPQEAAEHGVSDPFPEGVEVLSLEVDGSTATVDFSAELLDYGGGSTAVMAIGDAITETVLAATGATDAVILVEGEPDQLQP